MTTGSNCTPSGGCDVVESPHQSPTGPAAAPPTAAGLATAGPRQRTLAKRVSRLSMAAAALLLLIAGLVLNVAMYVMERDALEDEAVAQARVIAPNVQAPLLFGDPGSAQETLDAMQRSPRVARATLYDARRRVVADFRRSPDAAEAAEPVLPPSPGVTSVDGRLVVVEPVVDAAMPDGWLRLEVPLSPLVDAALAFGAVSVASAVLAMLLVWVLANGARRDVARIERRLDDLAYRDPVTNLFNRHAAAEHLQEFAALCPDVAAGFSILSFDLDDFKHINDSLGHNIGDEVLREVARRIQSGLQPDARAYRFGGDEFVVICRCPRGLAAPEAFGQSIRQTLGSAMRIEGFEISLSGSFGVARYPFDAERPEDVLMASDMAMYQAKAGGKNMVSVYGAELREASQARLRIESDLRQALRFGQLRLVYQPIVDLASGRIVAAEALVRWQHPTRGLLGPGEFIDVAEASGLVVPLGGWVLAEAARQLMRWRAEGLSDLRVAVNVSARQLRGGRLIEQVEHAIAKAGADLQRLGLEIELTEHTLVADLDENLKLLARLRDAGVRIAVDDFGTGLSSLSYLKRLPIDKLKIDRSFVNGLPDDASDLAIVKAALSMAHALGLKVVAEGVETQAQRDTLAGLGCDLGQGWLFGRPLPAAELAARVGQAREAQVA